MYFSQLQQHLAKQRPGPVYVLYGNNALEVREALEALKARAAADGDAGMSVIELARDERDLADVMDALQSVPMFVEYVMVVLQDAGEFINRHRSRLEAYLDHPSPTGTLVMTVDRWNRSTKIAKKVEALDGAVGCWLPRDGGEVLAWVQRRARSAHGKRIDASAARLLADLCQDDPAAVAAELDKLAIYVGEAPQIGEADVAAAAMSYAAYRPFDLCDRLAEGDLRAALAVVEGLLSEGLPAPVFVGTLRSHFRRLMDARALAATDGMAAAVTKFAGPPKQRDAFRRQLERFSSDALVRAHRLLLEADLASKTSRLPERLIVERLLLALSSETRTARG